MWVCQSNWNECELGENFIPSSNFQVKKSHTHNRWEREWKSTGTFSIFVCVCNVYDGILYTYIYIIIVRSIWLLG